MKVNLSIVLDKDGNNRLDLYQTNNLKEMDDFLLQFNDHKDVRSYFIKDVEEFLLDNYQYIKYTEKKNNRLNNGHICITFYGKGNMVRMVPIIYKNSPKLMNKEACFNKIFSMLDNKDVLHELFTRKNYLLSQYERDLLRDYFNFSISLKRYKLIFIKNFLQKLRQLDEEKCYYYLRSLMNVCNLKEEPIVSNEMTTIREDNLLDSSDDYFANLVYNEDYDNLFKYYGIDEIDGKCKYIKIINRDGRCL